MKKLICAAALVALTACGNVGKNPSDPPMFDGADLAAAAITAVNMSPQGSHSLMACGGSVGQSYFNDKSGWTSDGITKGATVFVSRPDGSIDIVFRDSTKIYTSSIADGGMVTEVDLPREPDALGVLVRYPNSGLTETYNVYGDGQGGKILLYTVNKPPLGMAPARASLFVARCMST